MEVLNEDIIEEVGRALHDLEKAMAFDARHLLVLGCSTSEVGGKRIGTSGSMDVAASIYRAVATCHDRTGVHFAFQCCEHLNRALVMDRKIAEQRGYEPVTVRPVRHAGGAMATYAYEHLQDPVVVEFIKADGGIDIGDTLIGMHLKPVAVPVRSGVVHIGHAHITMARTRPKLIGGERAVYPEAAKVWRI
ncbi:MULTISPECIES: TIGR01440 family protein [unclassified Sporolactobacillus]|uniref:TIGR01440 family protein n=1 Tax=unclassified Sporolactobacillus TaxID=2628533 RepID=UPI0023681ABF|nr:TIGR01440 family protein [Sporolactobacillus sp. CQH2019]MDD9148265.1 TIGR01440 family protein [Sporolactobacillus sp. CQH2019]